MFTNNTASKTEWEDVLPYRSRDMLKRMMKWSNSQKNVWFYILNSMDKHNKLETTIYYMVQNIGYTKKVIIEALNFLEKENCIKRKTGVIMVNPRCSWSDFNTTEEIEEVYKNFNS